jgi:tripartite-type tricarboxylate transporter receptor subunit TctC
MIPRRLCLAVLVLACLHGAAWAQAWPNRPIRVLIPFGAGSATDVVPRVVFEQLTQQLGQPIVVENRTGAGGTLATGAVAKADPDGYTLLATSNAHTIAPFLYGNLSYDVAQDFAAVAPFVSLPAVLIIAPAKGIKTLQDLVAAAKAKPGAFNFASVGIGSGTHLSVEKFRLNAGLDLVHVPFRGGPEALTEVIAGRVELYFCPLNTALPHIREGKVTALVVNTPARVPALPEVPTLAEVGYPNADVPVWLGMFAPAKTPRDIVEKLNRETIKALQTPVTAEKLAKSGVDPMPMTPQQFEALVAKELPANAELVKAANIKVN